MPTLVLATGFGHGINVPAAWNKGIAGRLFADLVTGTPQIVSDGAGGFELEVSAAGATEGVAWDSNSIGTATGVLVAGFPLKFPSLPTSNAAVAAMITSNATRDLGLWFRASDNRLVLTESTSISSTTVGTPRPSIDPLVAATQYWIDVRIVVTGTTWAVDWAIDGVAQTAYTTTGMGSTDTVSRMELGYRSAAYTYTARYKNLLVSRTSADYPLGKHKSVLLKADTGGTAVEIGTANGTGRMVTNSAIDSTFNSANILAALAEGPPPTLGSSASGVGQRTSGTGIACGIPMTTYALGSGETISGVRVEVVGWAASALANSLGLRTFNGTVETMLLAQGPTGFDNNTTTPGFMCKMATAADFDTQAELDALVVRLGYSTDISPLPGAHAIYAEVAIKEGAGTTPVSQSIATSWNVKAEVTDTVAESWNARAVVTDTVAESWSVKTSLTQSVAEAWSVKQAVTDTVAESWLVREVITKSSAQLWNVGGVLAQVTSSQAISWHTRAGITDMVAESWAVKTSLTDTVAQSWATRQAVESTVAQIWNVGAVAAGGTYTRHVTIAAPRTGGATHTVHPDGTGGTVVDGSAFTPIAGRLLVCFVEGGVTSTTPTGWSLPTNGSAVNFTGLYVFYRAAASGTSADQIVTTHNGSDYPVVFDFYEFPAGSTFVKSASAVGVNTTAGAGPTLSGLTGTNWTAGVAGRGLASGLSVGTVTWDSGTKEVDTGTTFSTTDGYNYSLTYTVDNVASSQAYAATFSVSAASVERLVIAVNVAGGAGTTSVSQSIAALWHIRAAILKAVVESWHAREFVSDTLAESWSVKSSITQSVAEVWNVKQAVTDSVVSAWNVRAAITSPVAQAWHARASLTDTVAQSWSIKTSAAQSVVQSWRVRQAVEQSSAQLWNVAGVLTAVTSSQATSWRVRQAIAPTLAEAWNVRAQATSSSVQSFSVKTPLAQSVAESWRVRQAIAPTVVEAWNIRAQATSSSVQSFSVKTSLAQSVAESWRVRQAITKSSAQLWNVAGLLTTVTKTQATSWNVVGRITPSVAQSWAVKTSLVQSSAQSWSVKTSVSKTTAESWRVQAAITKTVAETWGVRGRAISSLAHSWHVRVSVTQTSITLWNVAGALVAVTKSVAQSWRVRAITSSLVAEGWNVRVRATESLSEAWGVRRGISGSTSTSWRVSGRTTASQAIFWHVIARVTATYVVLWNTRPESFYAGGPWSADYAHSAWTLELEPGSSIGIGHGNWSAELEPDSSGVGLSGAWTAEMGA